MNTVDPRWKNGIDFEDVNSLLHIMIRNKDTDVFLILTLPLYGTSSIRIPTGDVFHMLPFYGTSSIRIPITGDVFHMLPFYGTSSIRKRTQTPIYSGYLPETFSTPCVLWNIFHPNTYGDVSQTSFMFNTSPLSDIPIMNTY